MQTLHSNDSIAWTPALELCCFHAELRSAEDNMAMFVMGTDPARYAQDQHKRVNFRVPLLNCTGQTVCQALLLLRSTAFS